MPSALATLNECVWGDYLSAQQGRLAPLPDVSHLTPRVVRIMGGNAGLMRLQGTNTYLIGTGRRRLLIDTGQGFHAWIDSLLRVLDDLNIELSHVLLTHWHSDHTGGVPDLLVRRPEYADCVYKCDPDVGQRAIVNGQVFSVEGATVRAVFTPGHAHDHMCFMLEEENALFTGDNVLGQGQSVFEDLGTFTQSLADMAALGCRVGYPGHGPVIADLPHKMDECIRQKEARERHVRVTLEAGRAISLPSSSSSSSSSPQLSLGGKGSLRVTELVERMYGGLPGDVSQLVVRPSVLAILDKLAEERKVGFEMVHGEQRWFAQEAKRPRRLEGRLRPLAGSRAATIL
ncbi:Putative metallo-beta-lactamase, winged helix-like DNA-binding domain superfamily [Colletotrichum destructivum]|uniref:Metallo-beta-lactamase, winged helix-like DNA-binding domain superfamily n=1 Tax=Colletotrichum destructivum TaxID=34406 RepID=A0AAX4I1H5_9PEZI|nr:Putative metallo-beta-lactamase, winged helix-like DNA-binding domain superfamily [Colletotrichum destructivum]